jgi:hypothetical protein
MIQVQPFRLGQASVDQRDGSFLQGKSSLLLHDITARKPVVQPDEEFQLIVDATKLRQIVKRLCSSRNRRSRKTK